MNDKQKIVTFLLALLCNFTFLATAQNVSISGKKLPECTAEKFGKDSLETKRNMAALQDDYKLKNYTACYYWWHYLFTNAPCSYKQIYVYGPIVIEKAIADPKFASRKQNLIDTLFMSYEKSMELYPETSVKGNFAFALSRYSKTHNAKALQLFEESINETTNPATFNLNHINAYSKLGSDMTKAKQLSLEEMVAIYQKLTAISVNQKNTNTDSVMAKNWGIVENNVMLSLRNNLSCSKIDSIYQPKLKANPNDTALLELVLKLYEINGKCNNTPNYIALVERSFSMRPNATAAEMLADQYRKAKNIDKLAFYAEKTAELTDDKKKKESMYLILAEIHIKNNPSLAKSYANKALEINPNNGKAYIYIGIAIHKSACGDAFDKAMHACVALEYFSRAKSVDASVTADANKKIAEYSKFVPKKADAFLHDKKSGDSYTIPCSGYTATVKVR